MKSPLIELSEELGNTHTKLVAGGISESKARELASILRHGVSGQLTKPQVCKLLAQETQLCEIKISPQGRVYGAGRGAIWELTPLGAKRVSPETTGCYIYFFKLLLDGSLIWLEERKQGEGKPVEGTLVWKSKSGSNTPAKAYNDMYIGKFSTKPKTRRTRKAIIRCVIFSIKLNL